MTRHADTGCGGQRDRFRGARRTLSAPERSVGRATQLIGRDDRVTDLPARSKTDY